MVRSASRQTIRIMLRTASRSTAREVTAAARDAISLIGAAGARSTVRAAGPPGRRRDWRLDVSTTEAIGSPTYAAAAWDLAHRLRDTDLFERAEADVPVGAFAPGAAAASSTGGDCTTDPLSVAHDWALTTIRRPEAMAAMAAGVRGGVGVLVGHPDSGFTTHPVLGPVVDTTKDWDVIDGDPDATDPLGPPTPQFFNPLPNPGHGTSTASVILGSGDGNGFQGVAPRAVLVPFRATESVVQLFDSDVADAVRRARLAGCHVVSMSLGGTGFFGLREAIQEAVDSGMVVMAAAGNQVGIVTAPASYDNCLAVAATGTGDRPWSGSSHGPAVDVAAPGTCVWRAAFDWSVTPPGAIVERGHGTSFAVAHVAGVVALWLAHHGHQNLAARYGRPNIQAVLLGLLNTPGVCARPAGWNDDWGVGRIDAAALLAAPLPVAVALGGAAASASGAGDDPVDHLAALTCTPSEQVRDWLVARFGADGADAAVHRFGGELAYLVLADPSFRAGMTSPALAAFADAAPAAASPQLTAALAGR